MFFEQLFKKYKHILHKEVCDNRPKTPLPGLKGLPYVPKFPVSKPMLCQGAQMRGQLQFQKEMRINSHFEGELISEGKLIIGPDGFVKANIALDEIEIYGRVCGSISANKVLVRKSAYIDGKITAKSVIVEEGAKILQPINIPSGNALAISSAG